MSRPFAAKRKAEAPAAVDASETLPEKRARVAPAKPDPASEPAALRDTDSPPPPQHQQLADASPAFKTVAEIVGAKPPANPGRLARLLGSSSLDEIEEVIPVDVLLRPADPSVVPLKLLRRAQEKWLNTLMYSIENAPHYFAKLAKEGVTTTGVTMKMRDHPSGPSIPYKICAIKPGLTFKTPLLMGHQSARITPSAGKAAKDRYSAGKKDGDKKDNDSNSYYLEVPVMLGSNEIAGTHRQFLEFLETDLARYMLVLTCKEQDTNIGAKNKVLEALINKPSEGWRGEFENMDAVPADHPKLREFVKAWLSGNRLMVMNKTMSAGAAHTKAFTFKRAADEGWGKDKKEWQPLDISYQYVGRDGRIKSAKVYDDATVGRLIATSPYTLDVSPKVNYDKTNQTVNASLQIEKVIFFPQLHEIVEPLCQAHVEADMALSREDEEALQAIEAAYRVARNMPPAITHLSDTMRVNTSALTEH